MRAEEKIARDYVAPAIIRLLEPWSPEDLSQAIAKNQDLAKSLRKDRKRLSTLQLLIAFVPYKDKLLDAITKPRWINWFIDNQMNKLDGWNVVLEFNPAARPYLYEQTKAIVRLLTEEEAS